MRKRIFNVLKAATNDTTSNIVIERAKHSHSNHGTLDVYHGSGAMHSIRFKLSWKDDHYVGHFVDGAGKRSQAVISLYNPFDAAQFVVAMNLLVDLRAKVHNATK